MFEEHFRDETLGGLAATPVIQKKFLTHELWVSLTIRWCMCGAMCEKTMTKPGQKSCLQP
jgi:hypothetical protein